MSLESRNFIATENDIAKVAAQAIDGEVSATEARGVFFKALIATTQHELCSPPRQRNVQCDKLSAEETKAHLAAFETVAQRFCTKAREVAANTVPDGDGETLRSRTRKFYSAASTIRGYIRASNDIRGIAAHKATKSSLATPRTKRRNTVDVLKRRVASLGAELEKVARSLATSNHGIAAEVLTPWLAKLAVAAGATAHATRDADKAATELLPWQTKGGMFVPLERRAIQ